MIVVTGATSRTGGVVARRLLAAGASVRVVGRNQERLQELVDLGAEAFVGDPTDPGQMRQAFAGGRAAWVMLQPNYIPDSPDFRGFQDRIIDAVVPAIAAAGLTHVVSLSGTEADLPSGTGPVMGLRRLEQRLDGVEGLNVLHLRAGYFMENLLPFVGQISAGDVVSSPFSPAVPLPLVATRDLGAAGAEALLALDFRGRVVRELQGERDLTLQEAVAVMGRVLGRPGLRYVQVPMVQAQEEWRTSGMSDNVVGLMTEVTEGINSRGYHVAQARDARTATPTTLEEFTEEFILPELRPDGPSFAAGQRAFSYDPERLADEAEITRLMYAHCEGVDSGRFEETAELYADGTWYASPDNPLTGADEVDAFLRENVILYGGVPGTRHLVSNVRVDFSDDRRTARGKSNVVVFQVVPGAEPAIVFQGTYEDVFAKDERGWHFTERRIGTDGAGDMSRHLREQEPAGARR